MAAPAAAVLIKRRKKKIALLNKHRAKQNAALNQWFDKFDINHDKRLEKQELTELLKNFQPEGGEPDEQMVDYLVGVSETIDGDNRGVKRESLAKVMMVYRDYASQKKEIDLIFDEFDTDNSGFIDRKELIKLLQSYHDKHPDIPNPEEDDVEFILDIILRENDKDHSPSGSIARDEILPAIATWKRVASELSKSRSRVCVIM